MPTVLIRIQELDEKLDRWLDEMEAFREDHRHPDRSITEEQCAELENLGYA